MGGYGGTGMHPGGHGGGQGLGLGGGQGVGGGQDGADGQVFCDWAQLQPPVVVYLQFGFISSLLKTVVFLSTTSRVYSSNCQRTRTAVLFALNRAVFP